MIGNRLLLRSGGLPDWFGVRTMSFPGATALWFLLNSLAGRKEPQTRKRGHPVIHGSTIRSRCQPYALLGTWRWKWFSIQPDGQIEVIRRVLEPLLRFGQVLLKNSEKVLPIHPKKSTRCRHFHAMVRTLLR